MAAAVGITRQKSLLLLALCLVPLLLWFMSRHTSLREYAAGLWPSQQEPRAIHTVPDNCTCSSGSIMLKESIPKDKYKDTAQRRAVEYKNYKSRTESNLETLLLSPANSPLQYPTSGFRVQPLTKTTILGLAVYTGRRVNYKVSLRAAKGVWAVDNQTDTVKVKGNGEKELSLESSDLPTLNALLSAVTYTSAIYHALTGDLINFQFESHKAVFPIIIKQRTVPILYDIGTDIRSRVTVTTRTTGGYRQLDALIKSIQDFYKDIQIIVADDSFSPQKVAGKNVEQNIMPPGQGLFPCRNLAISQVTTKYFLWVDDDFLFTEQTKIEKLVEVMEAMPELDVVGGSLEGQTHFSLVYKDGEGEEGGCLERRLQGTFQPLPGFPQCSLTSGVGNFFLARTDAARTVGFDPRLRGAARSEFFIDGLGTLLVASCDHVSIGRQEKTQGTQGTDQPHSNVLEHPQDDDTNTKQQLHFYKNHLKCIRDI